MHKIYIGIALIAILCQCSVSSNEKDAQDQKSVKNVLFVVVSGLSPISSEDLLGLQTE